MTTPSWRKRCNQPERLADSAWSADPNDPKAQALLIHAYAVRTASPDTLVQERLIYVDRMTAAHALQLARRD